MNAAHSVRMFKTDPALEGSAVLAGIDHPAVAAVMSAANLTLGAIRQAFPNADDRVTAFIAEEIRETVFSVVPELNRRVKEIQERLGDTPSASQATQIWTAFVRGFASAETCARRSWLNTAVAHSSIWPARRTYAAVSGDALVWGASAWPTARTRDVRLARRSGGHAC